MYLSTCIVYIFNTTYFIVVVKLTSLRIVLSIVLFNLPLKFNSKIHFDTLPCVRSQSAMVKYHWNLVILLLRCWWSSRENYKITHKDFTVKLVHMQSSRKKSQISYECVKNLFFKLLRFPNLWSLDLQISTTCGTANFVLLNSFLYWPPSNTFSTNPWIIKRNISKKMFLLKFNCVFTQTHIALHVIRQYKFIMTLSFLCLCSLDLDLTIFLNDNENGL